MTVAIPERNHMYPNRRYESDSYWVTVTAVFDMLGSMVVKFHISYGGYIEHLIPIAEFVSKFDIQQGKPDAQLYQHYPSSL